ncbi:MAG: hypothetical protein U0359_41940 [Byssovorax sp.]
MTAARSLARRAARMARALGALIPCGALVFSCSSRALYIELSDTAISIVGVACTNRDESCAGIKTAVSCEASFSCQWDKKTGSCLVREPCVHEGSPDYDAGAFKAIRVGLLRADPFGLEVITKCRAITRATDASCAGADLSADARRHCATLAVSEAIDRAIGGGLSFDGFHDPSVAFPIVALYQPKVVPAECLSDTKADVDACRAMDLPCTDTEIVACGGLAVPVNEQAYDLTCASCQDGLPFALGRDNGPCPQIAGHCFFEACAKLLSQAKLP